MRTSVDVHNFLVERDVPHELVPVRGRLRSPDRAAAILGLPREQVGRVDVMEGQDGLVAVLVPSDRRADPKRAASAAGTDELTRVPGHRAADLTDFLAEAIPPAGLPEGTLILIDRSLAEQEILYFPGGEASALLKIRPDDLVRATEAKVAEVAT